MKKPSLAEAEALLREAAAAIEPPSSPAAREAEDALGALMPGQPRGLARTLLLRYLAATGKADAKSLRPCAVIFCADHSVARHGVSAYPQETTLAMTKNYLVSRGAAANIFSEFAGANLLVCDVGIAADTSALRPAGLLEEKIACGTRDITEGAAMTREQALRAVAVGLSLAKELAGHGYTAFLPGEMGIANTTSSACLASVLLGLPPEKVTGRGSSIEDARLARKIRTVTQALEANELLPAPPLCRGLRKAEAGEITAIDLLAAVGGFEFGAMAGLMLGAAEAHAVTILDGMNTAAAAAIAQTLCPAVTSYLLPSQENAEPAHALLLKKLGLQAPLHLDLRLSETAGSALISRLLHSALCGLHDLREEEDTHSGDDEDECAFFLEKMPKGRPNITDRTFDFYLHTMPEISRRSMQACLSRLNHLTKPLGSLGALESIAAELAGILCVDCPEKIQKPGLLLFGAQTLPQAAECLIGAAVQEAGATLTYGKLRQEDIPETAAFNFGRVTAEDLTFETPLIGLGLTEKRQEILEALQAPDGSLRYAPDQFLRELPRDLRPPVSALVGALIAAAHNSALILLDDDATELVARCTKDLCPEIRPYLLPLSRLISPAPALPGERAALGFLIVEAALAAANDMKTFREARVSPAASGLGKEKQR
jgi:nicotinate-nucleotide--dimethylbenzimidazole phosphoribosyltransferase